MVLQGDLKSISFPDIVSFLANSSLVGVVTVASDNVVSKLYVERGVLCLAALNDSEPSSTLITLLTEADVLPKRTENLRNVPLFDLELASILLREQMITEGYLREALREHARFILSQVFQLDRGSVFFSAGTRGSALATPLSPPSHGRAANHRG